MQTFTLLAGVLPKEYSIFDRTVLEDLLRRLDLRADPIRRSVAID